MLNLRRSELFTDPALESADGPAVGHGFLTLTRGHDRGPLVSK